MKANNLMLHIKCRFKSLRHIVCDYSKNFYQLSSFGKRTKPFRKLNLIMCGGSYGYRINRKFYSLTFLRKDSILTDEWVTIYEESSLPF